MRSEGPSNEITLRDYQRDIIENVGDQVAFHGRRRICLVAPTGSGKTVIAAEIIRRAGAKGKRVLVLAHTREIIGQTSQKLHASNISHGIIAAELTRGWYHSVQVASIQTFHARVMRAKRMEPPPADLIFIDECHHIRARTWSAILGLYPDVPLIGLTATPCRGDGRGLGEVFDVIVECPQVPELIQAGYLVGTKTFAPPPPDLQGVKAQAGDFVTKQLGQRMNTDGLVGDILAHWFKYADGLKTIVFGVDVAHSRHIADEFVRAGVRAEHLDGSTPKIARDAILKRLADGTTTVVSNCLVLTEGFDLPDIQCLILARPTRQIGLYRQMIGRGLRPAEGKDNLIVLDHSGAILVHGPVEDRIEWSLSTDRRVRNELHDTRKLIRDTDGAYKSRLVDCKQCGAKRLSGNACIHCGYFPQRPANAVVFDPGELALYDKQLRKAPVVKADAEDMATWHGMLLWIQRTKNYSPKFALASFRQKFGCWPPYGMTPKPIPPSDEVNAWVRSRLIAYANRRSAA